MTTRRELSAIPRLAAPVVAAQMGWMMLGLVDTFMVGRLGSRQLAAVALGDLWMVGTILIAMGVMMGLDPIVSQAHGAGDGERAARALQRGIALALGLTIPVSALWLLTGPILRALGQDAQLAADAHQFVVIQIFSIAPFLAFIALRQYLQGRTLMLPGLVAIVIGNVVNALLDWLLIFGHAGFPAMGVAGSGLATGITRVLLLVVLVLIVRRYRLHRDAWVPWSRSAFNRRELFELLAHGLPVGLQLGLEIWAFAASSVFAGWIGTPALAAHTVVLKLSSFSYMVPLGISIATATRVGNLVGAGDRRGAQTAAWVGIALGGGVMLVSAAVFVVFRTALPRLFLGAAEGEVLLLATGIMPIAAAFQFFDGTQAVGGGVLRGLGRTRPAALANLVGYYVFALPLGCWLGFASVGGIAGHSLGLRGVWIGLAAGLATVAVLLVLWIWRGPSFRELTLPPAAVRT